MRADDVSRETNSEAIAGVKPVIGVRRLKEPMVAPLKTRIFTVLWALRLHDLPDYQTLKG